MSTFAIDGPYAWRRRHDKPYKALEQDALRAYNEHAKVCFEKTGSFIARNYIVTFVNGFAYCRGPVVDEEEVTRRQTEHREHARSHSHAGTSYYEAELRPEVTTIVRKMRRHPPVTAPMQRLVEHLAEAIDAHGHVMGDLHWRMVGSYGIDWPSAFHEITGEAPVESSAFVGGVPSVSTRLVRKLIELARLDEASEGFRTKFHALLRDYGLRTGSGWGSQEEFAAPTWNMRPETPLAMIASYRRADLDELEGAEARARKARAAATRRMRRKLKDDPKRLARFERALAMAIRQTRMMEDHNHLMDNSCSGFMHEAVDLVARRLVDDGVLDEASNVLHLSLAELRSLPPDPGAVVAARQAEYEARLVLDAPAQLGASEKPVPSPFDFEAKGAGLDGSVLKGIAASRGRYTGRARVVAASPYPPDVDQGDVLVTVDAGPAWTPVFPLLGGLVLERGAVFQHAALMAREYAIPAVLGASQATAVIADGQIVTVDGTQGVVELT